MSLILIQTTTSTDQQAETIASALIEQNAVACTQISGPVISQYRWQGRVEKHQEYILAAKAPKHNYPQIADIIREYHPYEVPEIIAVPICHVSPDYLAWVLSDAK